MSERLIPARMQFRDNSNNVLAGGKLYFYEVGTTDDKNTYSDAGLINGNDNPVILDAQGFPPNDIFGEGPYKLQIDDSTDAPIDTFQILTKAADAQPKYGSLYADIPAAVADGQNNKSQDVVLPVGSTNTAKITIPTGYPTKIRGRSRDGTDLTTTNNDSTEAILINNIADGDHHTRFEDFSLTGSATAGHGINSDTPKAAPHFWGVRVTGFDGSGKDGIRMASTYISSMHNCVFDKNYNGLNLVGSNGLKTTGLWFVDNDNYQLLTDSNSKGNDISMTELGLGSIDATKKALYLDGHNSRFEVLFGENFSAPRNVELTADSFNNFIDIRHWGLFDPYDLGDHNIYHIASNLPYLNRTSGYDFSGPRIGTGAMTNLCPYSDYVGTGASTRFSDFGFTPAVRSIDTTVGIDGGNSLKLDFGTTGLSGALESTALTPLVDGDFYVYMFWVKPTRDLASDESFSFIIQDGTGGINIKEVRRSGLFAGEWTPVTIAFRSGASYDPRLRVSMTGAATHSAIALNLTRFGVFLNEKQFTYLENRTSGSRARTYQGPYMPELAVGNLFLETPTGKRADVGGTLDIDLNDHATTAVTTEEDLYTYTIPAETAWKEGMGLKIRASGACGAGADTKRVRLYIGGLLIADTSAVANNGGYFCLEAEVYYLTSSTARSNGMAMNDTVSNPRSGNGSAAWTSNLDLKVTGQNGAANANDILVRNVHIELISGPGA